eukprot:CAMPEP_0194153922 /NCGR_PEP_ID=MMETSP0152-20130528/58471_1 /TAXON_ID=1049557 /ORGANISM="Thalassiothrix antarctica, Strain L6-D1" /LENGTH=140 /DNA_ID=CAMNT_0038859613 /DNA_START=71 /DNA_END=490 /DNA_ORIENTATION=+
MLLSISNLKAFNINKFSNKNIISPTKLHMAPKYDRSTQRWEAATPEEGEGYPPTGSLLRQGPLPFIQRLTNTDKYDQAVLKMMANEKLTRNQAQGSFDAYLRNPSDWAVSRKEEEKGNVPKIDYENVNTSPKQIILTGVW